MSITPEESPLDVLLVDDEQLLLSACAKILTDEGYSVRTATSFHAALDQFEQQFPAVVIADLMLPDGDGIELLKRFRTLYPPVVVSIISGFATQEGAEEARKAGALDFLPKPFTATMLRSLVARSAIEIARVQAAEQRLDARPNLFSYATSELSQDAFLAWLLAWADPEHADTDAELHCLGRSLVAALFAAAGVTPPEHIERVKVTRQFRSIDILATINETHVIAIEDKVDTSQHSDQLDRYRLILEDEFSERQHAKVYLRVGDQSCYVDVTNRGWCTFGRGDLLRVLEAGIGRTANAIFLDFVAHLRRIEREVQSYLTLPPSEWNTTEWSQRTWSGFFMALREQLDDGQWGYVPNARGGFMAYWWGSTDIAGGEIYLQLQEDQLVVKVSVEDPGLRRTVRDAWSARLTGEPGDVRFARPARLRPGRWMTVAACGDYRQVGRDGRLDVPATAALLRRIATDVRALAESVDINDEIAEQGSSAS